MNAFAHILNENFGEETPKKPMAPVGRVVGLSFERVLIAGRVSEEVRALRPGDLIAITSCTPGILCRFIGFETPVASEGEEVSELIVVETEILGSLTRGGLFRKVKAAPPIGAEAFCLEFADFVASQRAGMRRPIEIGRTKEDAPVHLDADRLFTDGAKVVGPSGSGKSTGLAVLLRGILREKVPARLVLADLEGVFAKTFGGAAEVVDVSRGLMPLSLLNEEEFIRLIDALMPSMGDDELNLLPEIRQEAIARGGQTADFEEACGRLDAHRIADAIVKAASNPRMAAFFGRAADKMLIEEVLQLVFRLPVGSPPMAVLQFHHLPSALRPVALDAVARLASVVVEESRGTIPVLLAVDEAHRADLSYIRELTSGPRRFGLVTAGDGKTADENGIVLRLGGEEAPSSFEPGAATLEDPAMPAPVSLKMRSLPKKALPLRSEPPAPIDPDELLRAITEAWRGSPLY